MFWQALQSWCVHFPDETSGVVGDFGRLWNFLSCPSSIDVEPVQIKAPQGLGNTVALILFQRDIVSIIRLAACDENY